MQPLDIQDLLGREIRQLNRIFLTLVVDSPGPVGDCGARLGLPPRIVAKLTRLGAGETDRIVDCPYALFEITIPLDARRRSIRAVADRATDTVTSPGSLAMFRLLALMCQRAIVRFDRAAAQLTFGLIKAEVRQLDRMSLDSVVRLAATAPEALHCRFAGHPSFWTDLIHLAAHGTDRQLAAAHLAGQQWIAARIASDTQRRHCQN